MCCVRCQVNLDQYQIVQRKEGWLTIKDKKGKKNRWVVLEENRVQYYDDVLCLRFQASPFLLFLPLASVYVLCLCAVSVCAVSVCLCAPFIAARFRHRCMPPPPLSPPYRGVRVYAAQLDVAL